MYKHITETLSCAPFPFPPAPCVAPMGPWAARGCVPALTPATEDTRPHCLGWWRPGVSHHTHHPLYKAENVTSTTESSSGSSTTSGQVGDDTTADPATTESSTVSNTDSDTTDDVIADEDFWRLCPELDPLHASFPAWQWTQGHT